MRTIVFSYLITNIICVLFVVLLWRQNRNRFAGTAFWVVDFIFQAVALFLIVMRGTIPDWASMVLSNTLVIVGAILGFVGQERFLAKKGPQIQNYLLVILFISVHSYFSLVQPNLAVRNINIAAALLLVCFQSVWLMWHRVEPGRRSLTFGVGMVNLLYCLVSSVRIAHFFVAPHVDNNYMLPAFFEALMLLSYQVLFILLTYSFVLMVNKRLIMEVRTQEEKFSRAFHSAPYAITITRPSDGKIIEVNEKFSAISGYGRNEVLSNSVIALHLWERDEDRAAMVDVLSRTGNFHEKEVCFRGKSGKAIVGLFSAELLPIDGENFILSSIADITERKQAEEEMQRRKEEAVRLAGELAVIAEIGRVISSTLDIDEVYELFATEAQKLIPFDRVSVNLINHDGKSFTNAYVSGFDVPERRPGSIIPMAGSVSEIFIQSRSGRIIHVESHEDLVRQFPGLNPSFVVRAGIRSLIGVPLISRNEVIGNLHFRSKTLNAYTERDLQLAEKIGMQIAGAIANTRLFGDLSKTEQSLRESEEHYRDLFSRANEGLLILTPDGQLSEVNQAFAEMHGYTVEELNLKDIRVLDVLTDRALTDRNEIGRRIKDGEVVRFEVEHYHKDGHVFPLTVTSSMIQLGGQNYYLAFHQDITERRRALEMLEEERRQLRQALDEIKTLRGIVPICSYCKNIRDDEGYWNQVEQYVSKHTDAKFSHGICPACLEREMKGIETSS